MIDRLVQPPLRTALLGAALAALSLTVMPAPANATLTCRQEVSDCRARCERLSGERQYACLSLCRTTCKPEKWGSRWPWKHPRHPWPFPRPPKGEGPMAGGGKPGTGPGPRPVPLPRGETMFRGAQVSGPINGLGYAPRGRSR